MSCVPLSAELAAQKAAAKWIRITWFQNGKAHPTPLLCREPETQSLKLEYWVIKWKSVQLDEEWCVVNMEEYFIELICTTRTHENWKVLPLVVHTEMCKQISFHEKWIAGLRGPSAHSFQLSAPSRTALAIYRGQLHPRSCPCWSSSHFMIKQGSVQRPSRHSNLTRDNCDEHNFAFWSFVGLLSQFIFSLYLVLLLPTSFHKFWSPKFCTLTSRYLLWRTQPVIPWPSLAEFSFCIPWYVCSTQ